MHFSFSFFFRWMKFLWENQILCSASSSAQSWTSLRGLIQNAIYGPRIDTEQDELKMSTLINIYFNDGTENFMIFL